MGQLEGKVAVVTGGALGIGAAYCKRLAEEGAKVVVADIEDGSSVVGVIEQAAGKAIYIETDVTSEKANMTMAARAVEAFGRLDILVANAGLYTHLKRHPSLEETVDEWDAVYNVNIKGVWLGAKACIPEMKKNGYGKIVNIASTAAFQGTPGITRYAASKAAVVAILTDSLTSKPDLVASTYALLAASSSLTGSDTPVILEVSTFTTPVPLGANIKSLFETVTISFSLVSKLPPS